LIWIKAAGIEDGNYEIGTTRMQPSVIVWHVETVPDLGGFEHSERVQDRQLGPNHAISGANPKPDGIFGKDSL